MPSNTLYGNKYKYILVGIDAASTLKVTRPLRTKQAKDVAEMIADIYKVGPLTYPKIFQCNNGNEFNNKTNDLILNLTPENVTQHSRIVTTTCKENSTPTKMSKIIGTQIH